MNLGFISYGMTKAQVAACIPQILARPNPIEQTLFGRSDIHTVQATVQMAAIAMSVGKFDHALKFINGSIPVAPELQEDTFLFRLLAMKALRQIASLHTLVST